MPSFADMLGYLRKRSGLSQKDLAEKIGVSRSAIGMYETGEREPDFETLEAIADIFNVNMDTLLGKSDITTETGAEKAPTIQTDNGPTYLEGTYLRLAQGAQELGLDDEDVDNILAIYAKHKQKNQ